MSSHQVYIDIICTATTIYDVVILVDVLLQVGRGYVGKDQRSATLSTELTTKPK